MSTEQEQVKPLHRRSDGFVETPDGEFAVVMRVATGQTVDGTKFFNFIPNVNARPVSVSWDRSDNFAIFPENVSRAMLNAKYAVLPTDDQVAEYMYDLEEGPDEDEEESEEPEKAKEPAQAQTAAAPTPTPATAKETDPASAQAGAAPTNTKPAAPPPVEVPPAKG